MEILWRRGSLPQNFTEIHAKKGKPLAMAHKHSCEEGEASRNGKRFFFLHGWNVDVYFPNSK